MNQLQATKAEVEQQVKGLAEKLAEETRRREGVEQQAGEIGQRRSDLEAELARLRQELETSQTQLRARQESSVAEHKPDSTPGSTNCTGEGRGGAAGQRLTETLAQETRRREGAEQQAVELAYGGANWKPAGTIAARVGSLAETIAGATGGTQAANIPRLVAQTQELQAGRPKWNSRSSG